jgi:hypothetical protein
MSLICAYQNGFVAPRVNLESPTSVSDAFKADLEIF